MITLSSLKTTLRYLLKDKLYLGVNILSLTIGLLCCLFAFVYIKSELSFDQHFDQADQVYRIEYEAVTSDGTSNRFANLHGAVLPKHIASIPEIQLNTRFASHAAIKTQVDNESFSEQKAFAADSNFFSILDFTFIHGDPKSALKNPNSVVLDKSTAEKYFSSSDVVGEIIKIQFQGNEELITITGVTEDVPPNTHFQFNLVTTASVYEKLYGFELDEVQMGYNYILLNEETEADIVETKLNSLPFEESWFELTYHLKKLTNIHLYSSNRGELSINGNVNYLYFLAIISLVILGISGVNFTTLATARSIKRTSEMGVRKAFGALRSELVSSFIFEGMLLSILGLILSYFIIWEFLPALNSFAGNNLSFVQFVSPSALLFMLPTTLLIGTLVALYPALFLTGNKSTSLLIKHSTSGLKARNLWKAVIVAQCTATLILISASYVIYQQINFIQQKDLGFSKDQVITIPNYFGKNVEPFLESIKNNPNILEASASSYVPGISRSSGTALVTTEKNSEEITFDWISVNPDYLATYDIELKSGRNFSEQRSTDDEAFIINETAIKILGWKNPIGKKLNAFEINGTVIGVVKDFNFLSLHNEIAPLIIFMKDDYYFSISAKLNTTDQISETLTDIEEIWKNMLPGTVFSYSFVDDQFEAIYRAEEKAHTLFLIFSGLAVFIATLGLFSFATYSIQQKRKEIGIRKVLGATIKDILGKFYLSYLKYLSAALVIAFPISYIWIENWLSDFSYHTNLGLDAIFVPVLLVISAIFISVSYQIIKGALANPVDSIRAD